MKISSLAELSELFRIMGEHGIQSVELEGVKAVRSTHLPLGGYTHPAPKEPGEEDGEGTEDDESLLYWSGDS